MVRYIFTVCSIFILLSICGCSEKSTIYVGGDIEKEILVEFTEESIKYNDWLEFEVIKDPALSVTFSKGTFIGNTFRITANEYLVDDNGILVLIKAEKTGTYCFKLSLSEYPTQCEIEFVTEEEIFIPEIDVKDKWKKYLVYIIILFVALVIFYIVYKRSKTFKKGTIHIIEPESENYKLKGKTRFHSSKEGCCSSTGIFFVLKKGKGGEPRFVDKSKDTILYVNEKLEVGGAGIRRGYEVKLIKGSNVIVFKYI